MTSLLIETLETRQLFSSFLDTSFGTGGVAAVQFKLPAGEPRISLAQIATDSQGRTYVVGKTENFVEIRRLNSNGTIDQTWFPSKHSLLLFQDSNGLKSFKIQIDTSDRLLVSQGQNVYRFTSAGALDTTFAKGGTLTLSDFTSGMDISVDSSNRLYATGRTKDKKTFLVERIISRGKLDSSFDHDGRLVVPLPSNASGAQGTRVRVLSTGKVVVAGVINAVDEHISAGTIAARLTANGTYDTAYGRQGITSQFGLTITDLGTASTAPLAIRADGSISLEGIDSIGVGPEPFEQSVLKNGSFTNADFAFIDSILEPDGGTLDLGDSNFVTRTLANGTIESNFNGGRSLTSVNAVDLLSDNSVLIGANTRFANRISIAKFLPGIDPANA